MQSCRSSVIKTRYERRGGLHPSCSENCSRQKNDSLVTTFPVLTNACKRFPSATAQKHLARTCDGHCHVESERRLRAEPNATRGSFKRTASSDEFGGQKAVRRRFSIACHREASQVVLRLQKSTTKVTTAMPKADHWSSESPWKSLFKT